MSDGRRPGPQQTPLHPSNSNPGGTSRKGHGSLASWQHMGSLQAQALGTQPTLGTPYTAQPFPQWVCAGGGKLHQTHHPRLLTWGLRGEAVTGQRCLPLMAGRGLEAKPYFCKTEGHSASPQSWTDTEGCTRCLQACLGPHERWA